VTRDPDFKRRAGLSATAGNSCFSGTSRLVVLPVRLSTVADRAFPVDGPRIWNDLPADVTSAESLSTFRQRLKTHLFTKSFPGHFMDVKISPWTFVRSFVRTFESLIASLIHRFIE